MSDAKMARMNQIVVFILRELPVTNDDDNDVLGRLCVILLTKP